MTAPLTPGAYIKARRCAALLGVEDVAARLACAPHWSELDRAAWLRMIEADIQPMTPWTVDALAQAFEFDRAVLGALDAVAIRAIPPEHAPPLCRICACSEYDPCFDQHDETCVWVEADLCSRCALVEGADVLDGDALTSSAAA